MMIDTVNRQWRHGFGASFTRIVIFLQIEFLAALFAIIHLFLCSLFLQEMTYRSALHFAGLVSFIRCTPFTYLAASNCRTCTKALDGSLWRVFLNYFSCVWNIAFTCMLPYLISNEISNAIKFSWSPMVTSERNRGSI